MTFLSPVIPPNPHLASLNYDHMLESLTQRGWINLCGGSRVILCLETPTSIHTCRRRAGLPHVHVSSALLFWIYFPPTHFLFISVMCAHFSDGFASLLFYLCTFEHFRLSFSSGLNISNITVWSPEHSRLLILIFSLCLFRENKQINSL